MLRGKQKSRRREDGRTTEETSKSDEIGYSTFIATVLISLAPFHAFYSICAFASQCDSTTVRQYDDDGDDDDDDDDEDDDGDDDDGDDGDYYYY